MASRKGIKNKRTLIREARIRHAGAAAAGITADNTILIDSLEVLEMGMRYFIGRFRAGQAEKSPDDNQIASDLREAMSIAREISPYQHARLATMRLATDKQVPLDQISKEELRARIIKEAAALGLYDATQQLEPVGIKNRE